MPEAMEESSLVKLLTTGQQLSSILERFTSSCINAPTFFQTTCEEINTFCSILTELRPIFHLPWPSGSLNSSLSSSLTRFLTSCEETFSKLEKEINRLKFHKKWGFWDRIRWSRAEKTIYQLIQRLQGHNLSLELLYLTFIRELHDETANYNKNFYEKLSRKHFGLQDEALVSTEDRSENANLNSTADDSRSVVSQSSSVTAIGSRSITSDNPRSSRGDLYRLNFESALFTSRAYRGISDSSAISLASSEIPNARWSMYTGGSNRAALDLPVDMDQISRVGLAELSVCRGYRSNMGTQGGEHGDAIQAIGHSGDKGKLRTIISGLENANVQTGPEDYELQVRFDGVDDVTHTTYELDPTGSGKMVEVKTKWAWKENIGCGSFGTVSLQQNESGKTRAVKMLAHNPKKIDYLRELYILVNIADHRDLFVQCLGWYQNRTSVFITMEYMQHGDLSQWIGKLNTVKDAKDISKQLLRGLIVLHERRICHRDIKPKNILVCSINPIHVKIADFGISKVEKNTFLRTSCGTPEYLAPEVNYYLRTLMPKEYLGKGKGKEYTNAVDIWALGCVLYEIFTSKTPFLSVSNDSTRGMSGVENDSPAREINFKLLMEFSAGEMELPVDALKESGVEDGAIAFLKRLIVANPSSRMSANDAFNDPWLVGSSDT